MIINKVMKLSKKNKEYIIPFNIEGIPIEYECLKSYVDQLMQILKDIPKEEYNKFYEIQKRIALEKKETLYPQSLTKDKTKENNSFINRFDLAISKEIISEKKVLYNGLTI